MTGHPYSRLPDSAYWRLAVAQTPPGELDPMGAAPFQFAPGEKVVTAGSCFAQHIGRYLQSGDCGYLVTERPHAFLSERAAQALNYGVYSARYGNVYTSRQLLQLMERAYGRFTPGENYWIEEGGRVVDPFRPQIQPGAFSSTRELDQDRRIHFAAVRNALETLDVFIFTLGLTEAWLSKDDGAVFPLCPGVAGGVFDEARHAFVNFGVDQVVDDMTQFIARLRQINPASRIILTVSPVPLMATAEPRHVLSSTVLSKSVLRVACDQLARSQTGVAYFPSYEIVAGGYAARDYFAADRRSVTPEGVAHVMRVFDRAFIKRSVARETWRSALRAIAPSRAPQEDPIEAALRLMCDEEAFAHFADAAESARVTPPAPGEAAPEAE